MFIIALAMAIAPAGPRRECRASAPAGCTVVTPLIDHGLPERLRRFLPDRRAAYLTTSSRFFGYGSWLPFITPRYSVADQMVDVLGGPADRRVDLPDGYLFAACRNGSCTERGNLIVDRIGRILAVSIIHYDAGRSKSPRLNIYARDNVPRTTIRMLKAWADHVVAPDRIAQRTVTRV